MKPNILQITPFVHVPDVPEAIRFFRDLLGFTVGFEQDDYAYLERENAAVRILKASQCPGEEVPPGNRRFMYYMDVRDLHAIIDEIAPRLASEPAYPTHGPVDQEYGQREYMIRCPDSNLVVFGQPSES